LGEQFALPVAVESLRAKRKQSPSGEITTISAADPLISPALWFQANVFQRTPEKSSRFATVSLSKQTIALTDERMFYQFLWRVEET